MKKKNKKLKFLKNKRKLKFSKKNWTKAQIVIFKSFCFGDVFFKSIKIKNKINYKNFLNKRLSYIYYNFLFKKFLSQIMLRGSRSIAYNFYAKYFLTTCKILKISPFFLFLQLLKKYKINFRLLGIRKRGKVVGIPVSVNYFSQYFDSFRKILKYLRKHHNKGVSSFLISFFTEQSKLNLTDLTATRMTAYRTANLNLRYSKFRRLRYRW